MNNEHKVKVISPFECQQKVSDLSRVFSVKSLLQTVTVFLIANPPNDVLSTSPPLTIPFPPHPSSVLLVVQLHL